MTAGIQRSIKCEGGGEGSLHTFLKRTYSENIEVMGETLFFIISCELICLLSVSGVMNKFLKSYMEDILAKFNLLFITDLLCECTHGSVDLLFTLLQIFTCLHLVATFHLFITLLLCKKVFPRHADTLQ